MAMSNYPNGFSHGVTIRGVPILNTYNGSVYYVDSVNGSNGHNGTFNWPKASIDYFFLNDIVRAGDIIICKPGHVETLAAASAWDIAGVCVIMDGEGTSKPYFNITATGGYINITGAGITLINPKFVTDIDQVVKGALIAAADVHLCNVEYHDAANKNSLIQILTTAAAHRMVVDGYRFFVGAGGTQKTDGIKTVGALNEPVLRNIQIVGDFTNAPVNISEAVVNVNLFDLNLNNLSATPQCAMDIHANTTGFAENVKARVASGTTYISSTAKIQWGTMCQGYNTDGSGGASIGAGADITAAVDSVGVQASVVDSEVQSVGIRVSVAVSTIASTGIQVSTVDSRVSVGQSKVDSVGVQASLGISNIVSTSARVGSVGTQGSQIESRAISVGTQASSVQSSVESAGIQVSTVDSRVTSAATSVGIGVSTAVSSADSTGIQVSTVLSQVNSTAISVGTGVSLVSSQVTSAATSVGIGVSTVDSKVTSAATSVGIGVSTVSSQVTVALTRSIRVNTVALAAGDMTGTVTQFTITNGPILVRHLGKLITTVLPAGANTLKFSYTPAGGGATDLCAATDTTGASQEQAFVVDGVKATALVKTTDVGIGIASAHEVGMPLTLSNGVIQTIYSAGPPATGAATLFMEWEPLNPLAAVA